VSAGRARGRVLPIHSASRLVEHPVGVRRFGQGRDWHATPLAARGQTGTVPVFTAIQRRDPRDDLFAVCVCASILASLPSRNRRRPLPAGVIGTTGGI